MASAAPLVPAHTPMAWARSCGSAQITRSWNQRQAGGQHRAAPMMPARTRAAIKVPPVINSAA